MTSENEKIPEITPETKAEARLKSEKTFLRELIEFALIAVCIVLPLRLYIAQPFVVNGASMDPTFANGQYLIVDQISYRFENPLRGSVLIFKYPKDPSKYFIKRVIGLPGETVRIVNGTVSIINDENPDGFILEEPYIKYEKKDSITMRLGSTEYFVMGDNRYGSADSRSWGALPAEDIVGRPFIRLFPITSFDVLPGDKTELFTK